MALDLVSFFSKKDSILLVLKPEDYANVLMESLFQVGSVSRKIGYISLNRVMPQLRAGIAGCGLDLDSFFFVDCITKSVISSPELFSNCLYLPSPNDLTKISISCTKMLKNFGPQYVFLDSISTLLIYEGIDTSSQFLHALSNKIAAFGAKSVFTCLAGDREESLIKSLSLIFDRIERV